MPATPRFTIIIPTLDRPHTFKHTLRTVLAEPSDALEVLVRDNRSAWDVEGFLRGVGDPRIAFSAAATRLSMSDNWAAAIEAARGEFLFVLGDDDGWIPGSLAIVDRLLRARPDVEAISWLRYDYGWPDAPPGMRDRLRVHLGRKIAVVPAAVRLKSILEFEYTHELLPKIYCGFLRRSLLDRFRAQYGTWFVDPINPDITTGMQALCLCRDVIFSERAFSIIGTSGSSNGLVSAEATTGSRPARPEPRVHPALAGAGRPAGFFPPALSILNTYLLVGELHGITAEVNLAKGIVQCANEMLRFPGLRTPESMAYIDRLAAGSGMRLAWPEVPPAPAAEAPVGLTFENDRPHTLWIDTGRIGISDIHRASVLAEMLSAQG